VRYTPSSTLASTIEALRQWVVSEFNRLSVALWNVEVFQRADTNAVARSIQQKLEDIVSVKDFGAIGDGTADDTAEIQAAIDAMFAAGGGIVQVPFGRYKISSTITLRSAVSLIGTSKHGAQFQIGVAGLTAFSGSGVVNVKVAGIDFYCTAANVTALSFTSSNRVTVSDAVFYGCRHNIVYDLGGFLSLEDCVSANAGSLKSGAITLKSSDDAQYGAVFSSIVNYRIENNGAGVHSPAMYFRRAVGIKITNLMTTNNTAHGTGECILIENDCQGITVSNGLIVDYDVGVRFQTGAGIVKPPLVNILSNVDFDQCRTSSIVFDSGVGNQVAGGVITSSFIGTTTKAIVINSAATENTLIGVHIGGYYGAGGTGVYLNGCAYNRLYHVQVEGSTNGVLFNGSVTETHISSCDFSSAVTNPIAGTYSGTGNRIIDVKGYSAAVAIASPAMPASTVGVTNNFGVACRVLVYGGTVNTVSINGNVMGFTGSWFLVMPGESISIDYTAAPNWNWVGL